MATIRKLTKGALRLINAISANEEPSADDMTITLKALNAMLDSMGNAQLNIFTVTPYVFSLTPGKQDYLVGPEFSNGAPTGADWITERPMRIEHGVLKLFPNNTNTLFSQLRKLTMMEYSNMSMRKLQNQWPTAFYDSGSFPTRQLSFWPVPKQNNEIELWMWEPITVYSNLDEELNLPPGYERYLRFKLAVEISAEFGKELSPSIIKAMQESEAVVKKLNENSPTMFGSSFRNPQQFGGFTGSIGSIPRNW